LALSSGVSAALGTEAVSRQAAPVGAAAADSATPGAARAAALARAKARAVAYFAGAPIAADPGWLSLFGYMHRRFGLVVRNASGVPLHEVRAGVTRPEIYAVYRRIDDPAASVDKRQIADLPTAIDRITASALHCDRIPLPEDWPQILLQATRAGAYALTHAVLAAQWSVENGCVTRERLADVRREQETRLVDLVNRRDELTGRFDAATDIWIEAIAMLYYSGGGTRVRGEWLDSLLALQRPDGGWPRAPGAKVADPHATALALWVLLENLQPAPPIAWIQRP
jgi:hypothetical protein